MRAILGIMQLPELIVTIPDGVVLCLDRRICHELRGIIRALLAAPPGAIPGHASHRADAR